MPHGDAVVEAWCCGVAEPVELAVVVKTGEGQVVEVGLAVALPGHDDWVTAWNENPEPFIWTKTAEQLLD